MQTPTKALIIGYVWPEPASSAAGSRMMQLIESMRGQEWQVTFASPAQQTEHMVDLAEHGVASANIQLNHSSFDDFVSELKPDLVIFDRFMMEEQFGWRVEKFCPDALRILNTEDLHSLRDARHQAVKQQSEFQLADLNSDLAIREIAAILRSDLTLMISEFEMQLLIEHFKVPEYQLMYLPFMLDELTSTAIEKLPDIQQRQHFISIGNFRHAPNWDAVLQLKQSIWPAIRKQLPKAELHIYGAYPPPKATQLHNEQQGFLVKGWAEEVNDVMQQARICLAPLRFGAGIKGKLSDAMLNGTPSITTPIGAESMQGELPWPGAVCDNEEHFIQQAVALYQGEDQWYQAQQAGFDIIQSRYQKSDWQPAFIERLSHQIQNREVNRQQNFYGLMLRHHSLKSTQYMAQWIEAKNRTNSE